MKTRSFKEIRAQYPNDDDFLVLVDCETRELPTGELEVLGAKHVEPSRTLKRCTMLTEIFVRRVLMHIS